MGTPVTRRGTRCRFLSNVFLRDRLGCRRSRRLALEPLERRNLLDAASTLPQGLAPEVQGESVQSSPAMLLAPDAAAATDGRETRVDLILTREPTALDDPNTGELEVLPGELSWLDEWDWFFAEIWASTPGSDDLAIASASVDLVYDTACFTAASIEYGPAFTETQTASIDDAAGRVEDLGGSTLRADVGDDKYTLLARVALEPRDNDPGLDHNAEGRYLRPMFDCGLRLEAAEVVLVGMDPDGAETPEPADTELWPVMYDIDDDAQVGFGDLAYFATAFQQQVGQPDAEFAWASDFDRSGRVDVGDLSFLAESFQRSRADGSPMVYPSWIDTRGGLPLDPADVAPALDLGVATNVASATEFLYTGVDPIQTGVVPGTIEPVRVAVLRGKVLKRDDGPLRGVTITVLDHPELGQTLSRADGTFDLAVNGGGPLTFVYQRDGYLPAQRRVDVPWQDYVFAPDVVMIPVDPLVTTIDLTAAVPIQVARGSQVTDADGTREATLLFQQGTTAEMVMPDGATQALSSLNVRATEYTVGDSGPNAMPAELPPTSVYTYCVELSADEAIAAGAAEVRFDQPVYFYLENFLEFPVGGAVPTGYYDRARGVWIASDNGRIIEVLAVTDGLAEVDGDGDGTGDDAGALAELGITDAEREQLAALYQPGESLWRVPLTHLTPYDHNWPVYPSEDTKPPNQPAPKPADPADDSDPCETGGSIIEPRNQVLGERIPVIGTPFTLNYRSDRVRGRVADRTLSISLSGPSVPSILERIVLEIKVAGQRHYRSFPPEPNQSYTFTWDGKDGLGRPVQGAHQATVRIGYEYDAAYGAPAPAGRSFGRVMAFGIPGAGSPFASSRWSLIMYQEFEVTLSVSDARGQALGAWTLDVHHCYDPEQRMLYRGDGTRRPAENLTFETVAGTHTPGFGGDGGPAAEAQFNFPHDIALGPDGSLYIADTANHRIRRIGPDGIITTVAGTGVVGYSGDGGPATDAKLTEPQGAAIGPDGSLYIADTGNWRVRRVSPDGIMTTFAGTGTRGFSGDDGPATQAELSWPVDLAVGPDGSVYIAGSYNGIGSIRRVWPDGIITTVAGGNDNCCEVLEGVPAAEAWLEPPEDVAVGPDGSLYIAVGSSGWGPGDSSRVRRVGPDGIITTVAGDTDLYWSEEFRESPRDGGPATSAYIDNISGVEVGPDGSLYIAEASGSGCYVGSWCHSRIRHVAPDGIITTVAGAYTDVDRPGGTATQARLDRAQDVVVAQDGSLYVVEVNHRIRRVASPLPGFSAEEIAIPSEDGSELYTFDANGRHLRTLNTLTGALVYEFRYDDGGRLIEIQDGDGNLTTIERDAEGNPTAIVAPFGQRTALGLDAEGYLSSISNPAGDSIELTYSADGLLRTFTDPNHHPSQFDYDELGRLVRDEDAAGGFQELSRTESENGFVVTVTTAEGRTTTYAVEQVVDDDGNFTGQTRSVRTDPTGAHREVIIGTDGSRTTTFADGTVMTQEIAPDPRWGMQAPMLESLTVMTPGGRTLSLTQDVTVTLSAADDPLSITSQTETVTINGQTYTSTFDRAAGTVTMTTPEGHQFSITLDAAGRVTVVDLDAALEQVIRTYDDQGRLIESRHGDRFTSVSYDLLGRVEAVGNADDEEVHFIYNDADRVTEVEMPSGLTTQSVYDANGNRVQLIMPNGAEHGLDYTPVNLGAGYTPPESAGYTAVYNADRDPVLVTLPSGRTLASTYDPGGCPTTVSYDEATVEIEYADATLRPSQMTRTPAAGADVQSVSYGYDGPLITEMAWSGVAQGRYTYTYDDTFRLEMLALEDASPVTLAWNRDSLLTGLGPFALARNGPAGALSQVTDGTLSVDYSYDSPGNVAERVDTVADVQAYRIELAYDNVGRLVEKVETVAGASHTYVYAYDADGQLADVERDGTLVESYGYDDNGNRTSTLTETATYDPQDRLLDQGGITYQFDADGFLVGRAADTFEYTARGELVRVVLENGSEVTYAYDALGRRVGRTDASGTYQYLYGHPDEPFQVTAVRDPSGLLTECFYTEAGTLFAFRRDGNWFYVATDQVGTPRVVTDAAGSVLKVLEYDSFGNLMSDSNPGFDLPFGFAGGLADPTTGLVRFGFRDYDPDAGRWTARDPILFAGGYANLYLYVGNNPITLRDPSGLQGVTDTINKAIPGKVGPFYTTPLGIWEDLKKGADLVKDARDLLDYMNDPSIPDGYDGAALLHCAMKWGLAYPLSKLPFNFGQVYQEGTKRALNEGINNIEKRLDRLEELERFLYEGLTGCPYPASPSPRPMPCQ